MKTMQSVFVGDMVLHISAYEVYKKIYKKEGYRNLRKLLRARWYTKSEQNQLISRLHEDELMTNTQVADPNTSAKEGAFLSGLRVRVKELSQEAKFIRHEEQKAKPKRILADDYSEEFWKLRFHRTIDVRNAARAAHLAYAFLRGVPYRRVEKTTYTTEFLMYDIKKEVKRLVAKFGKPEYRDEVDNWFASDTV